MDIITQKKVGTRNIYYLTTTDSAGIVINKQPFDCRIETMKTADGTRLIVPLDKDGNIRSDVYNYLNTTKAYEKWSTRRQIATSLNLLYVFCDLNVYDVKNLSTAEVKQLMNFLRGIAVRAEEGGQRTLRTAKTVNGYYGFIKAYIYDNEWRTKAFGHRVTVRKETTIGDITIEMKVSKDVNTLRTDPFERLTTPKHLKPEQVKELIVEIRKAGDITTYILVRLQVGHGLRCGEALGITIEDIKKKKLANGEYKYYIILRNRCSDADFQHCKGLYHPMSVEEYDTDDYRDSKKWLIEISEEFYHILTEYYKATRGTMFDAKKRAHIEKETRADSVETTHDKPSRKNYYLFVNSNGRLLSAQTYNNHLKKYFNLVGIPVDHGKKQTNCSHRLRHTFAMLLTTYGTQHASREQLMLMMRHASVFSSEPYFTPTEEEIFDMKEGLTQSIIENIPSLSDNDMGDFLRDTKTGK